MIPRKIMRRVSELALTFPVVTIEGPRQSGKTTLAKMAFPEYTYANLEDTATRRLAETDPRGFLVKFRAPAIIDEIQRVPSLLSDIQVEVDKKGGSGLYVLTGSHQPRLKAGVSQTLAGRTALVTLLPLSIEELSGVGIELSRDEYILRGFLPAIYDRGQNPVDAYEAYYRTYVERDVRQLVNITHQGEFELFLRLLAGRVGQVVNLEAMSGDVGVSSTTLKEWLSVLEASFVVFRVAPYYNNFGKRFVKSPKVYFTDVGLAAHLLDLSSAEQVSRDPLLGGLFENMVMAEALKARYNAGRDGRIYYMRDKVGCEIDLVVENQRRLTFIEIKSAQTPNDSMAANIRVLRKTTGAGEKAYVVYSGESWPLRDGDGFVNFRETATLV